MKIRLYGSLAMLLAFAVSAGHAESGQPTPKDFIGRWTVTEIVGYADIGGGIPLAKTLLGREMKISERRLSFGAYQCETRSGFDIQHVEAAPFLEENAGARPDEVGLPAQVYMLHSERCYPIFWVNQEQIEFDENGVFVRAQRVH